MNSMTRLSGGRINWQMQEGFNKLTLDQQARLKEVYREVQVAKKERDLKVSLSPLSVSDPKVLQESTIKVKNVTFKPTVQVFLIPQRREYEKAGLKEVLWNNSALYSKNKFEMKRECDEIYAQLKAEQRILPTQVRWNALYNFRYQAPEVEGVIKFPLPRSSIEELD